MKDNIPSQPDEQTYVHKSFGAELKSISKEFSESALEDLLRIVSVVRTAVQWFVRPLSIHHLELIAQREQKKQIIPYLLDYHLMKNIFIFSLVFLVVDEISGTENDKYAEFGVQLTYFLFFVALLFVFLGIGWLWKFILGLKTPQTRVFTSFLIYEYAVIFLIQFTAIAFFKISINGSGFYISYIFPLLHSRLVVIENQAVN